MGKITAILIMLFTIVSCAPKTEIVYQNIEDGVVFVVNKKDDKSGGIGTGFFIEENLIVTNYHVVKDSTDLKIQTKDSNHEWKATVISYSEDHDIALVKIDDWNKFITREKWKFLQFTPSEHSMVGETVYTLGHPWGLVWTFSKGILSHKDRMTPSGSAVLFLQVDAKVYQGNSGGPLFDEYGRVLGVNSQMLEGKGGSYGFVIPSQYVQKVIYDLKKYKKSQVMKLGILMELSEDKENVKIKEIKDGSSAEKCNFQKDDLLLNLKTEISKSYVKVNNMLDLIKNLLVLNMDQNKINIIIERNKIVQEVECKIEVK